jgi:hypothetical protein
MIPKLTDKLMEHFFGILEKEKIPLFHQEDPSNVARGVSHCEIHGIPWRTGVMSLRYLVDEEALALVLTLPRGKTHPLVVSAVREKLRIAKDVRSEELGLPIEHPEISTELRAKHRVLRFFWIHAVMFMDGQTARVVALNCGDMEPSLR